MSNFYKAQGKIITKDGRPIQCGSCPCEIKPGCCPGTSPSTIHIWAAFFSWGNPYTDTYAGPCITATQGIYGFGDGFWNAFQYGAGEIFSGPWNIPGGTSNTSSLPLPFYNDPPSFGCINYNIIGNCVIGTPDLYAIDLQVKSVTPTFPSTYTTDLVITNGDCSLPINCYFGSATDGGSIGSWLRYYSTDRPFSSGILCPDGNILATQISINLTLAGVDAGSFPAQPVIMTFTPQLELDAVVNLYNHPVTAGCYCWFGHYFNCVGHETRVVLWYQSPDWLLMIGDPAGPGTARIVYASPGLPTTDGTGDSSPCCDTYTMNYPAITPLLAPRVTSRKFKVTSKCEKCGKEKTKLIPCKSCRGTVQLKACPDCE